MHHPIFVLNSHGIKVGNTHREQADRMVALKQGKYTPDRRGVRLLGVTGGLHEHPCRTHTSRSAELGAIGRSQDYTVRERGQVTGLKKIFPEDLNVFHAATLDCMRSGWVGGGGMQIFSITITTVSGKTHRVFFDEGLVKSS